MKERIHAAVEKVVEVASPEPHLTTACSRPTTPSAEAETLGGMNEENNPILELLEHFDKLQLEVLAVHISIHQRLFRMIGQRLGCAPDDLPNLKFMHAAELAFAGRDDGNIGSESWGSDPHLAATRQSLTD